VDRLIEKLKTDLELKKPFFSWLDSELVKAVENGDWIYISGCENSSPALLEKLNGLLEDEFLMINECYDENNEVRIVKRHENFRIFFSFDCSLKIRISPPF